VPLLKKTLKNQQIQIAGTYNRDFSRGEQRGHFAPPENGFAPPGLCLNDKIDFNII